MGFARKRGRSVRDPDEEPERIIDPERARRKTFARATRLLAAKPRSIAELRERLLEKPWTDAATVDIVIERLTEYGYLDDKRFAAGHAAMRLRMKPVGRAVILRALAMKQVDRGTAEEAADEVFAEKPEEELIKQAIARRIRLRGKPTTRAESKSLFDHLMRRGFAYDLIIDQIKGLADLDEE
jgi:regulatory protein